MRKETPACDISVVIPAYNEGTVLRATLDDVQKFCERQWSTYEIIVVDDASSDDTSAVADAFAAHCASCRIITHAANLGKGASVRDGLCSATGTLILFMDADNSTPIDSLATFLPWFTRGFDIVIGSRYLPTSSILIAQSPFRVILGRIGNLLIRLLLLPGFSDTQCGFKMLSFSAAHAILPSLTRDGWGFDMELLSVGKMLGYRIAELPVAWKNSNRRSRFRPVRDAHRTLHDLMAIKWNLLSGRYRRSVIKSGEEPS